MKTEQRNITPIGELPVGFKSENLISSQIGKGINVYSGTTSSAAKAFPTCEQVRKYSDNTFISRGVFIESYEQFNKQMKNTSGMKVDLGFLSFGHKKQTEQSLAITNKTVIFLAQAYRKSDLVELDVGDFTENMSKHAIGMKKNDFYTNYGAYYVNSVQTGYCAKIFIYLQCNSVTEAQGVKKEMELKIKSEDGSGGLNLGNSDAFVDYSTKKGMQFILEHNLPSSAIEGLNVKGFKQAFSLLSLVGTLPEDAANAIMSASVSKYPQLEESSYAFTETTLDKHEGKDDLLNIKNIGVEFNYCNLKLSDAYTYQKFNSNFEEIDNIDEIINYYHEKISIYREIAEKLDKNPWANIDELYNDLIENYQNDPQFELRSLKLDINYITNGAMTYSSSDLMFSMFEKRLSELPDGYYLPKFTYRSWGNGIMDGFVFYTKNTLASPVTQPAVGVKWKVSNLDVRQAFDQSEVVTWLNNNLTPWQYYFTSITPVFSDKGVGACIIVYPEES